MPPNILVSGVEGASESTGLKLIAEESDSSALIAGAGIGLGLFLIFCGLCWWRRRRMRKRHASTAKSSARTSNVMANAIGAVSASSADVEGQLPARHIANLSDIGELPGAGSASMAACQMTLDRRLSHKSMIDEGRVSVSSLTEQSKAVSILEKTATQRGHSDKSAPGRERRRAGSVCCGSHVCGSQSARSFGDLSAAPSSPLSGSQSHRAGPTARAGLAPSAVSRWQQAGKRVADSSKTGQMPDATACMKLESTDRRSHKELVTDERVSCRASLTEQSKKAVNFLLKTATQRGHSDKSAPGRERRRAGSVCCGSHVCGSQSARSFGDLSAAPSSPLSGSQSHRAGPGPLAMPWTHPRAQTDPSVPVEALPRPAVGGPSTRRASATSARLFASHSTGALSHAKPPLRAEPADDDDEEEPIFLTISEAQAAAPAESPVRLAHACRASLSAIEDEEEPPVFLALSQPSASSQVARRASLSAIEDEEEPPVFLALSQPSASSQVARRGSLQALDDVSELATEDGEAEPVYLALSVAATPPGSGAPAAQPPPAAQQVRPPARSAGPQGSRSAGPQGSRSAGPQGSRSAGPQGSRSSRPRPHGREPLVEPPLEERTTRLARAPNDLKPAPLPRPRRRGSTCKPTFERVAQPEGCDAPKPESSGARTEPATAYGGAGYVAENMPAVRPAAAHKGHFKGASNSYDPRNKQYLPQASLPPTRVNTRLNIPQKESTSPPRAASAAGDVTDRGGKLVERRGDLCATAVGSDAAQTGQTTARAASPARRWQKAAANVGVARAAAALPSAAGDVTDRGGKLVERRGSLCATALPSAAGDVTDRGGKLVERRGSLCATSLPSATGDVTDRGGKLVKRRGHPAGLAQPLSDTQPPPSAFATPPSHAARRASLQLAPLRIPQTEKPARHSQRELPSRMSQTEPATRTSPRDAPDVVFRL